MLREKDSSPITTFLWKDNGDGFLFGCKSGKIMSSKFDKGKVHVCLQGNSFTYYIIIEQFGPVGTYYTTLYTQYIIIIYFHYIHTCTCILITTCIYITCIVVSFSFLCTFTYSLLFVYIYIKA